MTTLTAPPPLAASPQTVVRHGRRVTAIWLVLTVIATPLVFFVWGPHLPPGTMTDSAAGQQWDYRVLAALATPVVIFVWVMIAYCLVSFRQRGDVIEDGPPLHGNLAVQTAWIAGTASIVLFLAAFGTFELVVPAGAGGGEGPSAIWTLSGGKPLEVQVIGQEWHWSYRYPGFGGMESTELMLPAGTNVRFNVTSLDVIHSFWPVALGVKADANPGVSNVAFTKTRGPGAFTVRCAELCGLWHGAMFDTGRVMPKADFVSWAAGFRSQHAATTAKLPPYKLTYTPDDFGADGGDYPLTDGDPISTQKP